MTAPTTKFDGDDVIDSREIIERIEELQERLEAHNDAKQGDFFTMAYTDDERAEHEFLVAFAAKYDHVEDWEHGAQLIHESYFEQHVRELIDECYPLPKGMDLNAWPYRHMTFDFEAAADEAKQDYTTVDFGGDTYYVRA